MSQAERRPAANLPAAGYTLALSVTGRTRLSPDRTWHTRLPRRLPGDESVPRKILPSDARAFPQEPRSRWREASYQHPLTLHAGIPDSRKHRARPERSNARRKGAFPVSMAGWAGPREVGAEADAGRQFRPGRPAWQQLPALFSKNRKQSLRWPGAPP